MLLLARFLGKQTDIRTEWTSQLKQSLRTRSEDLIIPETSTRGTATVNFPEEACMIMKGNGQHSNIGTLREAKGEL